MAKERARKLGKPLCNVLNEALRTGLDRILQPRPSKTYRTIGRPLGLRGGLSYDNIAEIM